MRSKYIAMISLKGTKVYKWSETLRLLSSVFIEICQGNENVEWYHQLTLCFELINQRRKEFLPLHFLGNSHLTMTTVTLANQAKTFCMETAA